MNKSILLIGFALVICVLISCNVTEPKVESAEELTVSLSILTVVVSEDLYPSPISGALYPEITPLSGVTIWSKATSDVVITDENGRAALYFPESVNSLENIVIHAEAGWMERQHQVDPPFKALDLMFMFYLDEN